MTIRQKENRKDQYRYVMQCVLANINICYYVCLTLHSCITIATYVLILCSYIWLLINKVYTYVYSYIHMHMQYIYIFAYIQERKAVFAQMKISDRDKKKWEQVLELDYMSSKDTDGENKLKVQPLPWLSERVQKFKDFQIVRQKNYESTVKKAEKDKDDWYVIQ